MTDTLHPILAQMEPSPEQMGPILARGRDIAVTAGAGTGKTRTLVARYLSLLVDRLALPSIVAITFTRKAAREMRNRVRSAVRRYLQTEGLPDDERAHWTAVYAELDAARIGTIHSLCGEVLRHHPAKMSLDPRFEMLEEHQMALLQVQAVDAALGWAAQHEETARLFDDFGEQALRRTVGHLLERRLDVNETRRTLGDDVWSQWEARLVGPIAAFVDDPAVRADFADLASLRTDGTLARAERAGDALASDLSVALDLWDATRAARHAEDWNAVSRHLAPLRAVLKQKGRKANWAPAEPKTIIARIQEKYDVELRPLVKSGIDLALDQRLAHETVPALLRLYDRALANYDRAKRQQHGQLAIPAAPLRALDFDDLEGGAVVLLRDNPEVRAYWQGRVRALLVDEFQDTNARQRDLLDTLNGDSNSLFIVGDGKQSIYRFRGADVTVFRQKHQAIAESGIAFDLATSYRAHRDLIKLLNALLRPVLGESDPERPYVEPFATLDHHREDAASGLTPPYLELHLAVGSKASGALEQAARALVGRLATLVEHSNVTVAREDPEHREDSERPLDYGDVAILCRASASFTAYEDALENAGIPFLTVAGRGFYDRPEVRDVLNALRALADPTDDLALAGLLRSSALGLSDMALYRLRESQRSGGAPSLWSLLGQPDLSFLKNEAALAAEARILVDRLHRMVGRTAVADVLKAFLDDTAYRAGLLRAGHSRAAGNVDKLLADANASEIVGVGQFVDYIAELRDVAPREGEARAIATGAVQIMTVHQAKGLEFPVVVIGDAARGTPRGRGALIDQELGVVPRLTDERLVSTDDGGREVEKITSAAYRLAQQRDRGRQEAESDRLLYVAATRTQELLLISGTVSVYKSGGIGTHGWLDRLDESLQLSGHAPSCDGTGDAVHVFTSVLADQPVHCTIYEPGADVTTPVIAKQPPPVSGVPTRLDMLEPIGTQPVAVDDAVRDADRDPPRRVWRVVPQTKQAWAPSWVVGKLVHSALARWLFPDDELADFHAWCAAEAQSYGLTDEEQIRNAVRRASRMMGRFQRSTLFQEMASADRCLHEVPYSVIDGASVLDSGVIDAVFHDGRGWTLVEFKTDRIRDASAMEAVLAEKDHIEQVERYLTSAENVLGERPRAVLCFLNVGGHVREIRERW